MNDLEDRRQNKGPQNHFGPEQLLFLPLLVEAEEAQEWQEEVYECYNAVHESQHLSSFQGDFFFLEGVRQSDRAVHVLKCEPPVAGKPQAHRKREEEERQI